MSFAESEPVIPTWLAGLVVLAIAGTLAYGVLVMQSILAVVTMWFWLFGIGLSLFVVYLFYRFVLAVETIADKL